MNASYRLNTCKSRGSARAAMRVATTGARVSNAYPTWPWLGNSLAKVRVMPYDLAWRHQSASKALPGDEGGGCVRLGCWRGNGPPSLRSVGVLRGRSPTLELRHGPNSYGRQQCGILANGRKAEPAK